VDPVPDPLLLRKSGSAGNRTWDLWVSSQELRTLDHRGGLSKSINDTIFTLIAVKLSPNFRPSGGRRVKVGQATSRLHPVSILASHS
jgi:hypothetical protein